MNPALGAIVTNDGAHFTVRARDAALVELCLFDGPRETRVPMVRQGDLHAVTLTGVGAGQCYGYRAHGEWAPERGLFFDPAKLLVDPYTKQLDRRFQYDIRLGQHGVETAALVPKALVTASAIAPTHQPPLFTPGGLIYELNVRSFSIRHPDVPPAQRGTLAALGHPSVIAHLRKLGVAAIELMPIVAWIDERHLPPLQLRNAWGYNPVVPMALDPGLAPGGLEELRTLVAALRQSGIGVILDLVLNHTGESDTFGPTLSLRGLDNRCYARTDDGNLINDTGTGNTLDAADPAVQALILDTLRHFAGLGVDGFRLDLATVLARGPAFDPQAPVFTAIAQDPLLGSRVMIAEPWDVGPGGYQLGNFPAPWLEWNDRYRDDVRRFWRGDDHSAAALATRMMGSRDIFPGARTRSVNFIAAHDGFTLRDLVSYACKHNEENGERNRDGQDENFSWNNGAEGPSSDSGITGLRDGFVRALLATLFASRATIMLSAGDEFGRSQRGNNNAYAQDNEITWLDWTDRDIALEDFVGLLAQARAALFRNDADQTVLEANWYDLEGHPMTSGKWEDASLAGFEVHLPTSDGPSCRIRVDRQARQCRFWRQAT